MRSSVPSVLTPVALITVAGLVFSHTSYIRSDHVIASALNQQIALGINNNKPKIAAPDGTNATLRGPDAVGAEDLVLLIFGYDKHDIEVLTHGASTRTGRTFNYSLNCASIPLEFMVTPVYAAYLFSENVYVLQLPPDTKYRFIAASHIGTHRR